MRTSAFISLLTAAMLFACISASTQSALYTGYPTFIFETLGMEAGQLHDIAEDWNGFIWVASDVGLYRFDGTVLKHFAHSGQDTTLPHHQVFDIFVDTLEQVLWLGTGMGLTRLDPASGMVRTYQSSPDDPNSLADNIVRKVFRDKDGQLWVGCYNHGLSLYRPATDDFANFSHKVPGLDSLRVRLPRLNESWLNSFKAIAQTPKDGLLWLGTPLGLVSFDQTTAQFQWHFLKSEHPLKSELMLSVVDIFPYRDQLIVGTARDLYIYDPSLDKIEVIEARTSDGEVLRYVNNVYCSTSGELRVAYSRGLAILDLGTMQFSAVFQDNPELEQFYGIYLEDSNRRLWVYSSQTAILYDPDKQITAVHFLEQTAQGTPRVFKALGDSVIVLLNTASEQYHCFDFRTASWESHPMTIYGEQATGLRWQDLLFLDEKHWLLLEEDAIYRLSVANGHLEELPVRLPADNPGFNKFLIDDEGALWVATRRVGLFRLDLDQMTVRHYLDELNSPYSSSLYTWITDLHKDRTGHVWVRLARSYAIYQPEQDSFMVFSHYGNPSNTFRYLRNFAESPDGTVWMASEDNGLGKTDQSHLAAGVTQKYSRSSGLLSDRIRAMAFDRQGKLWIMSELGVSVLEPETEMVRNFSWDRGIPDATLMIPLGDDRLALALEQGIGILNTAQVHPEDVIPQPYISRVRNKEKIVYEGGNRVDLASLKLPDQGTAYLTVEFSALGYSNPKQFAYKLLGVDDDFVLTSGQRSASYSNLSPGEYQFDLKCRLVDGQWSEIQHLKLEVPPFWWQTVWFQLVLVSALLLLVYFIYRSRLDTVRQKERLRADFQRKLDEVEMQALRSQMNPHFLFNALNSIQMFIVNNRPMEAVEHLDNFSRLVRAILQNSRAKVIPLKDEMEALKLYMEMEKLRFTSKFTYQVEVADDVDAIVQEIPPMLLQPFVENAIWHGIQHKEATGQVRVKISREKDYLICSIEDDGIGRVAARRLQENSRRVHKSLGMQITKDRIDMLNESMERKAEIEVIDLYDEAGRATGTRVLVRLPTWHSSPEEV